MAFAGRTWEIWFEYEGVVNGLQFGPITFTPGFEDAGDDLTYVQSAADALRMLVESLLLTQNSSNTVLGYRLVSTSIDNTEYLDTP